MKTTPAEAKRRILETRLEGVQVAVKGRTVRKTDGGARLDRPFKTVVMTVTFTIGCEGKNITRGATFHRDGYLVHNGLATPIAGKPDNWESSGWSIPFADVYWALKFLTYGTTNVRLDPMSDSERYLT